MVLLDREENATNVCRPDQFANHADGLRARAAVDAVLSPILCGSAVFEDAGAGNTWVTRYFTCMQNP